MAAKRTATIKVDGPLGPAALSAINDLLRETNITEEFCKQCEGCKINVDKERALNAEQQQIAQAIKRSFFPSAP